MKSVYTRLIRKSGSFLDKTRKSGFDRLQFPGMHFEIGMKADAV